MAYKDIRLVDADGTIINAVAILKDGNEQLQAILPDHPDFKALKDGKFGPVAAYVAPVAAPVSAPRWKVLIVLNDRGLYDVINNELKKDLENKLEGSFANWQAWNNADRIASDSAIVAGLLSRFPLTNDDVYDIIQEANKISG